MPRILAIGLEDDAFDVVSHRARDLEVSRVPADSAAAAIGDDGTFAAIIVGGTPEPIALVRRCHAVAPLTPIIIVTTSARRAEVRSALRFSPNIGREVHCIALDEPDLEAQIQAIVRRGQLRASTATTVSALNRRLAAGPPPARSSTLVLDRLLEVAPIGILVVDDRRHIRVANPRAAQLLRLPEPLNLGEPLSATLSPAEYGGFGRLLDNLGSESNPREAFDLDVAGSPRRIEATAAPLAGGTDASCLILLEDITERHALLSQLRAANRRKDEFLALLGHELRNPLAPIRAAVDLLGLRGLASIERERAIIDRQLTHITQLVDDLLDISRITQGRIDLQRDHRDLADIVDLAVEAIQPEAQRRQQTVTVDVARAAYVVDVDARRIDQVITNLLSNAVRYSAPSTSIAISAVTHGDRVHLAVRDSGHGIEPSLLPYVFDMFVQAQQGIDRAVGGLGLGLAIVRSIVELHGGIVRVTSELGVGSEFVVELPLAVGPSRSTSSTSDAKPAPSGRVLVVDDNEDAAMLLSELLQAFGYEAHVAHTGPTGLELAERVEPDLVLLDIGLPEMDGYEVGRRLREMPRLRGAKIVAVTGYGQAEDRARSAAAGFHGHLVKPLSATTLKSTLSAMFRGAEEPRPDKS